MEPFAGTLAAILVTFFYVHSAKMVSLGAMMGGYHIWQIALGLHVSAWILQFIGHGAFEGKDIDIDIDSAPDLTNSNLGRAPALIDSWDQALLTAPLFVFLEVMFFLGYRKDFHDRIMKQVNKNIKEFKKQKKNN